MKLQDIRERMDGFDGVARVGRVTAACGTIVRAVLPDVHVGEACRVQSASGAWLECEVVGFDRRDVLLMPLGELQGVGAGMPVRPAREPSVPCGRGVRGRVLDALGRPLDRRPLESDRAPLFAPPPHPLDRAPIAGEQSRLTTGIRAIDGLLTMGRGQRIGIFAAAGGGKSTLLGMIARNIEADAIVVALIGERGREVRGALEDTLDAGGNPRATLVVSTSDEPALMRLRAAYTATAIAEAERRAGKNVVLLMDSVTRFARALRDVGLAAGEAPGRQGYPPSVYATLPKLFERAGTDSAGSITAFYTVLVAGDDLEEPIADETMSLLDGHVVLSREIAHERYPAIDILASKSRLMNEIASPDHLALAGEARRVLATHRENRDAIAMGLYKPESEQEARRVRQHPAVGEFLEQHAREPSDFASTLDGLRAAVE